MTKNYLASGNIDSEVYDLNEDCNYCETQNNILNVKKPVKPAIVEVEGWALCGEHYAIIYNIMLVLEKRDERYGKSKQTK